MNGNISNRRFHHDPLRKFMAQRDSSRRKTASYSDEGDLETEGLTRDLAGVILKMFEMNKTLLIG